MRLQRLQQPWADMLRTEAVPLLVTEHQQRVRGLWQGMYAAANLQAAPLGDLRLPVPFEQLALWRPLLYESEKQLPNRVDGGPRVCLSARRGGMRAGLLRSERAVLQRNLLQPPVRMSAAGAERVSLQPGPLLPFERGVVRNQVLSARTLLQRAVLQPGRGVLRREMLQSGRMLSDPDGVQCLSGPPKRSLALRDV
jgi:hypothetical protein